jgi:tetratricopeptide (TPR) repeat protein
MNARTTNIWSFAGMALLWGSAFCVSCWLTSTSASAVTGQSMSRSVAGRVLGESRVALGGYFYLQADNQYHGGVEHIQPEAFENSIYQKALKEISPRAHIHMKGKRVEEMMPWLWLAIRSNPQDVNTYLVAAFWLASDDIGKPDLAHEVLKEAQCNIPFHYETQLEDGRIYLKERRTREAKRKFDAGLAFWPRPLPANNQDAMNDKAALLLYRGLLHEAEGETNQTIEAFEEILRMFPERTSLRERLDALKKGEAPSVLASRMWHDILEKDEKTGKACDREEAGHKHDKHD